MQNIISSPIYQEQSTQETSKLTGNNSEFKQYQNSALNLSPFSSWEDDYENYTPNTFDFFETSTSSPETVVPVKVSTVIPETSTEKYIAISESTEKPETEKPDTSVTPQVLQATNFEDYEYDYNYNEHSTAQALVNDLEIFNLMISIWI